VTRYLVKTGTDQAASQPSLVSMLFQSDSGASDASASGGSLLNLLA
jgi:hypothetical protein